LYGKAQVFEIDVQVGTTVPVFIVPNTGVKATRIVAGPLPITPHTGQSIMTSGSLSAYATTGRQPQTFQRNRIRNTQDIYKYPFQLLAYPLRHNDANDAYALRERDVSDMERAAWARQKAATYFADEEATFPLSMALTAVAVMKPAAPSEIFRNWTLTHQEDLLKRLQLAGPAHADKKSFDVYGNPAPLSPSANEKE
jgi:hypothetical protein